MSLTPVGALTAQSLARDTGAVAGLIREHLLPPDVALTSLKPVYSRFKGENGGLVTYGVALRSGASTREALDSYVTVRTGPQWRLASQASRFLEAGYEDHSMLRPSYYDEPRGLLLMSFPLDRALPELRKVLQVKWMRRWLEGIGVLQGDELERVSTRRSAVRICSYRPERRAVLRFDTVPRKGRGAPRTFFLRLHADARWPTSSSRALDQLVQEGMPVPTPLGRPAPHASFETACAGRPLVVRDVADEWVMRAVGSLVARIHNTPCPSGLSDHSNVGVAAGSETCAADLFAVHEGLGARARAAVEGIGTIGDPPSRVLLHGDLHPRQFLRADRGLSLIDWDRAGVGDAAMDLGTLAARLHFDFGDVGQAGFAAVLAGYREHRDPPPNHRLSWHRLHAWLRLVNTPFRSVVPNWVLKTEVVLAEIERGSTC